MLKGEVAVARCGQVCPTLTLKIYRMMKMQLRQSPKLQSHAIRGDITVQREQICSLFQSLISVLLQRSAPEGAVSIPVAHFRGYPMT